MKPILVNLEPVGYSKVARKLIEAHFEYHELLQSKAVDEQVANATVIISRLGYKIDRELIGCPHQLKFILTATTGTNHIDLQFVESLGAKVLSLKGETDFLNKVTPTAEHTWGLLLALCRNYQSAFSDVESFNWNRDAFLGKQLFGKTIGVVGLGRLGKLVARYAEAFGMRVIYNDIVEQDVSYERVELLELMSQSDVITIHVPLDKSTTKFINTNCFKTVKKGAILINTARGEVIDEQALLCALQSGGLNGAAIDVVANESTWSGKVPLDNEIINYARSHSNLIVTPHIGGACPDAMRMTEEFIAKKLVSNFLKER